MEGGFKDSPLKVNEGLGTLDTWNKSTIEQRADKLADLAASVWNAPKLAEDVLQAYKPEEAPSTTYTIQDHEYLADGKPMRELFDTFRKQVLALDPAVTEEFLKLYVAYKAETNFVDVVPQAKRLRLSLNMDFHEINDPQGMAKDVTGLGRWGNGNAEIGLETTEQIPYAMGLVRQSFEKQMGGEEMNTPTPALV